MKILVLLFIFSLTAKADVVPLPAAVMGTDELIEEFRAVFKTKLVDISKNYYSTISGSSAIFRSSDTIDCNGNKFEAGVDLSSFKFYSNLKGNELIEKATYTGCNDQVSLVEDIYTRGTNLQTPNMSDLLKGKRSFDLNDNESQRIYKLSNGQGEEIFKVVIEKTNLTNKFVSFYYIGQRFLTINYTYSTADTSAVYTMYSYSAKYVQKYSTWSTSNNYPPLTLYVFASKNSNQPTRYTDGQQNQLSLTNFLDIFDGMLLQSTFARLRSIITYHTYYFPATQTAVSGSSSQRLLEELRINLNRLNSNIEVNLVKNYLQDLINSTENGLIIDNRPRE